MSEWNDGAVTACKEWETVSYLHPYDTYFMLTGGLFCIVGSSCVLICLPSRPTLIASVESYSAFCRKYRTHSTGAIGYRNWNEEAIKAMVGDLEGPWLTLDTFLQTQKNEAVDSAMNLTDWGIDYLGK